MSVWLINMNEEPMWGGLATRGRLSIGLFAGRSLAPQALLQGSGLLIFSQSRQ